MEQSVLAAQTWVNATYATVTGFTAVPEDGVPGWATMHALTRALQHELGIAVLSDTFGPATLTALQARGGVLVDDANTNLITIVQSACCCKGYDPGALTGVFTPTVRSAVNAMMADAGLTDILADAVPPKIVKALLTMDAYTVLPGGEPAIRAVQRWLNGRYLARTNVFVIACDGILTRDIQKALYVAIQYETGLTDSQADGAFGPQSKNALNQHLLAEGDTGPFVRLFTAAIIFNRVRLPGDVVYTGFADSFGPDLTAAVRVFQTFSELPVTGAGDYPTWCQALVSNGDANRPAAALDCITTITDARAATLLAAGYTVVGRYLDEQPGGTLNKKIQPGELDTIFGHGMRVFPISEYSAGSASYFTYAQGYQDATNAHAAATGYGFNLDTTIYFAVDYDATQADITNHIIAYFTGVAGALATQGKRYIPGIYGSRNVCAQIAAAAYTRWSFVAGMSYGYSGNMSFPLPDNWAFNQIQGLAVGTGAGAVNIDKDVWRSNSDPAVSSVNDPAASVDAFINYIDQLAGLATRYSADRPPDQLVLEYLRHETHRNDQWQPLLGALDADFIAHVAAAAIAPIRSFRDPGTGIALHVSRLAAACNSSYLHHQPPPAAADRGDIAGWGGDWMTFYGEWRRDNPGFPSAATYCQQRLARLDGTGTFTLRDLIEDADAHTIALRILGGATITEAISAQYLGGAHLTRFTQFFTNRFGSTANAATAARSMLTRADDTALNDARAWHIHTTGGTAATLPHELPSNDLDELCQGFADTLNTLVDRETGRNNATPDARRTR